MDISDKHRQVFADIIQKFEHHSYIEARWFRQQSSAGMDVKNWLLEVGFLIQKKENADLRMGIKFRKDITLYELLNPPKQAPTMEQQITIGQVGNLSTGDNFGELSQSIKSHNSEIPTTRIGDRPITKTIIKTIIAITVIVISALIIWKITGQV